MTKNYTIHIGLPKTGTTSIQKYCRAATLPDDTVFNPSELIKILTAAVKVDDADALDRSRLKMLKEAVRQIESTLAASNILLSHEILSQRLGRCDLQRRGNMLREVFPEAQIFLTFRYQPALLKSLYLQHFKQGYIVSPRQIFHPHAMRRGLSREARCLTIDVREWDYAKAIHHFRQLFPGRATFCFYENFNDITELGRQLLQTFAESKNRFSTPSLSGERVLTNPTYRNLTTRLAMGIAWTRFAFRESSGLSCALVDDLRTQADYAILSFDACDSAECIRRVGDTPGKINSRSRVDRMLTRGLKRFDRLQHFWKAASFELPEVISDHLRKESCRMNESLPDLFDSPSVVPDVYFA